MTLKTGLFGLIAAALLASCSTSNDVVSGRGIQKRKYNDGYYISSNKNFDRKSDKHEKTESVLIEETITEKSNTKTQPVITENNSSSIPTATLTQPSTEVEKTEVFAEEKGITQPAVIVNETKDEEQKIGRVYAKKTIKTVVSNHAAADSDVMFILLVILCFFIPPLAVGIFEGITGRFWIDLILFLLGWGVGWYFLGGLAWICGIVAIVYALLIVLSVI